MVFGIGKIINYFAMNIDKLDLTNLVGEVMDKIVELKILITFRELYIPLGQIGWFLALRK